MSDTSGWSGPEPTTNERRIAYDWLEAQGFDTDDTETLARLFAAQLRAAPKPAVAINAWLDWADAVHAMWMTPWYVALALMGRPRSEPRRPT